jgi:hypothetical protein
MVIAALLIMPVGVVSAQTMTGAEIKAALEGNSISNENEVQYFSPDGTAIYHKGAKRVTGNWGVEGDKFCSDLSTDVRPSPDAAKNVPGWKCHPAMGDKKRIAFIIDLHAYSWVISEGKKVD